MGLRAALLCLLLLAGLATATPTITTGPPSGWHKLGTDPNAYDVGTDGGTSHSNHRSAWIKAVSADPKGFGTLVQECVADHYHGSRLRFSAWVESQDVSGWGGIWLRVDDASGKVLSFQNMQDHPIRGTNRWTQYSLETDVPSQSSILYFGLLLHGTGQLWMDDLSLRTVGRAKEPASRLPPDVNPSPTNLHFDP